MSELMVSGIDLQKRLLEVLSKHPNLKVYSFSLNGSYFRSNTGSWEFIVHLEDSNCQGGVRHISVAEGSDLHLDKFNEISVWIEELGDRYHVPRPVTTTLNGPS